MLRAVDRWLPGYLRACLGRDPGAVTDLVICVADHFEPLNRTIGTDGSVTGGCAPEAAVPGLLAWCDAYRRLVAPYRDSDGRRPIHTFFYPWDEYAPSCLAPLVGLVEESEAEVEVHLHHRHDTPEGLRQKLCACRDAFADAHGLLGRDAQGHPRFGFVHGNWALANARADGDWCGVNTELQVLRESGCYADFTFPSAPSPTQPRLVNLPYLAVDTGFPGAASTGRRLRAGGLPNGLGEEPGLPIIPGPLGPDWGRRKWGLLPRLENAELSGVNPPDARRLACWQRIHVHVPGRSEWCFIKLHTHGWVPANRSVLLGGAMARFHDVLEAGRAAGAYRVHYVSARELYNMVGAAVEGLSGDPGRYRDHLIAPPTCRR